MNRANNLQRLGDLQHFVREATMLADNQERTLTEIMMAQQTGQRRLEAKTMQLKQERDTEIKKIERAATLEVREQQDKFKLLAVLLPPIPPLLVGLAVFFNRRAKEKEGVSKARLR